MKKLPNSPKASVQSLTRVLRQKLTKPGAFRSQLSSAKEKRISESVVNEILDIIDKFLVDFTSETIDEVCGRIQSKIDDFRFSDEAIDAIKSDKGVSGENSQDDVVDAVCKVLNGINKDSKFDDLKKYLLLDSSGGETEKKEESDESSIFGKFFSNEKKVEKILKDSVFVQKLLDNISDTVEKAVKPLVQMQAQLNRIGTITAKAMLVMVKTHVKYLVESILLKLSMVVLAASNLVLAASNLVLAASNLALSIANVILAVSRIALAVSNVILLASNIILAVANITLASIVLTMAAVLFALLLSSAGAIFLASVTATVFLIALATTILAAALSVAASAFLSLAGVAASMVMVVLSGFLSVISIFAVVIAAAAVLMAAAIAVGAVIAIAALAAAAVVGGVMVVLSFIMAAVVSVVSATVVAAIGASALLTLAVLSGVALVAAATLAAFSLAFSAVILAAALVAAAAVLFSGILVTSVIGLIVAIFAGLLILLLIGAVLLFMDKNSFINTMVEIAKKSWETVKNAFGGIEWSEIRGWAKTIQDMWERISKLWDEVGDVVTDAFKKVGEALGDIFTTDDPSKGIWAWVETKYEEILKAGDKFKDTIIGKIVNIAHDITEWWKKSKIKESLKKLTDKVIEIAKVIKDALYSIGDLFGDVWSFAHDFMTTAERIGGILVNPSKQAQEDVQAAVEKKRASAAMDLLGAGFNKATDDLDSQVTNLASAVTLQQSARPQPVPGENPNDGAREQKDADDKKLSETMQQSKVHASSAGGGIFRLNGLNPTQTSFAGSFDGELFKNAVGAFTRALYGGSYGGAYAAVASNAPRRVGASA